ncbi:ArsR/SmtB family transcription factor [Mycolicibacter longobardus]|uniref:ArsR family transcriptional regulator n=1 Tax=Mycolicibacter longobardus TaxID=1108812 RepID=A0A1X1YQX8_9MYCO|nr:metalloregulator ArsR/SmtB family transcription factor [Mycolicibacter longobardus]MCV7382883.1 winged helix-turn-helix transcriptional regulator [Mycolicibacter longobardus]ORW13539.1 ArsR family transcriptional regulator [Mycolicibacter longobardus]
MAKDEERPAEKISSTTLPGEPTPPQLTSAASTFALLSSPARLHVMWLAAQDAYDVTTLAGRAGINVATMSQHLTKLRLAGLINARREGRHHIYTVDDPHILTLLQQIFAHIAPDGTLAPDPPRETRRPRHQT